MDDTALESRHQSPAELKQRYRRLKEEQPELRARNAAEELGVAEGVLLAAQTGEGITRLVDEPENILRAVAPLGEVMALTRNDWAVHERKGVYDNASFFEHGGLRQGLFVNPDIDLRLFMNHWKFCYAVTEQSSKGERKSLQFFDRSGAALHKIYLSANSVDSAYQELVTKIQAAAQPAHIDVEPYAPKAPERPDDEIEWAGLRMAWEAMRDTHEFFPMLKKFKVGRLQALRRIGDDFARSVPATALRATLNEAAVRACPIMVFVGNRGCIQIHSGTVQRLVEHGPWYNVLDPMFNLHVREDRIAESWVTRKPTEDGVVTALELFDDAGELIVTLFGKRKPGIPELTEWREIIAALPTAGHPAA